MKILLMSLVLVTLLSSNELQRVQEIVDDITKLRLDYESCQKQLSSGSNSGVSFEAKSIVNNEKLQNLEANLRDEKQRSKILLDEIDVLMQEKHNNVDLQGKIRKLEKIIDNQEISLKTKENVIKNLRQEKSKTKEIAKNSLKNSFPKLIMKEGFESEVNSIHETQTFKASAFRVKNDAGIYDNINGKKLYIWEKSTSFTSNEKSDTWVKITGYFIDKKWLPSKEELWIKSENVLQRENLK